MAQCLIPNTPQLLGEVEVSTANEIQFTIQSDLTAYLYQVYLLNGENLENTSPPQINFSKPMLSDRDLPQLMVVTEPLEQ